MDQTQHLAQLVDARKTALAESWDEIAARASETRRISSRVFWTMRKGVIPREINWPAIEAGLRWPRGTIKTVLDAKQGTRFDHLIDLPIHTADVLAATPAGLAQTWHYIEQAGSRRAADKWLMDALRLRNRGESRLDVLGETG